MTERAGGPSRPLRHSIVSSRAFRRPGSRWSWLRGPARPYGLPQIRASLSETPRAIRVWVHYRPERLEDYADFAHELARRVKPRGVNAFQLWNEPDHRSGTWLPGPDPQAYAGLLKFAYPAIKTVNANARVLVGGLVNSNYEFLQDIYDHGSGRYFDGIANHVYPQYPPKTCPLASDGQASRHALCGISRVRKVLNRNGDAHKPIWLTELSWSSCRCHYQQPVDESTQAVYLRQAYSRLARMGGRSPSGST